MPARNFKKAPAIFLLLIIFTASKFVSQDHTDWSYNLGIYEVNIRQYTEEGTFRAFAEHLGRLKEMGVGILWFMPIHPIGEENRLGSLGSYYSVKDYKAINPEFGTLEDFKWLVDTVHSLGMYAIIDWVGNHTAWDNPLTETNPEWYVTDEDGNFIPPPGTNWSDVIQLDYTQQGLRDYMIEAMEFWVTEVEVDGFRCDAVSFMPNSFWLNATNELKQTKSDIFMLAEDDDTDYQNIGFDASYAWGLHGFGNGVLKRIVNEENDASDLHNYIRDEISRFNDDHYRLYFTSNHDENSWFGTVFEQFGNAAEPFAVLTFLFNGMPLVYSGQEAGMDTRLLFFDKDLIPWQPHPFYEMYQTLFELKYENSSIWNGEAGGYYRRITTTDQERILSFKRESEEDRVFAVFNLSDDQQAAVLADTNHYGWYREVFTGDTVVFNNEISITLSPWDYRVYELIDFSTDVKDGETKPLEYNLKQNYPNPFNPVTTIEYTIAKPGNVELSVYNMLGENLEVIVDEFKPAGSYQISFDASHLSSGVYFYRIASGDFSVNKKMIHLK